jgi:hypothetical protein
MKRESNDEREMLSIKTSLIIIDKQWSVLLRHNLIKITSFFIPWQHNYELLSDEKLI